MSEHAFEIIGMIYHSVHTSYDSNSTFVSLSVSITEESSFFVRNKQTGELALPVQPGVECGLTVSNFTQMMAAFPVRFGNANNEWLNMFTEEPTTDPSEMPPGLGMLEVPPSQTVRLDGLYVPGGLKYPLAVRDDGIWYRGRSFDRIEVSYRVPQNAEHSYDAASSGVASTLSYQTEAHSFGTIQMATRTQLAYLLAQDGLPELDPMDDRQWRIGYFHYIGAESLFVDLKVDSVTC